MNRLWFLPPRFIDDIALLDEYEFTTKLLRQEVEPHIPEVELFSDFLPFVFLRHEMVESELIHRGVDIEGLECEVDTVPSGDCDFPFDELMVQQDVEDIMEQWEEHFDIVEDGMLVEELSLISIEDLHNELSWLFDLYKEEYEL